MVNMVIMVAMTVMVIKVAMVNRTDRTDKIDVYITFQVTCVGQLSRFLRCFYINVKNSKPIQIKFRIYRIHSDNDENNDTRMVLQTSDGFYGIYNPV